MELDEFNKTARTQCGWYDRPCGGELVWCSHPDNKNRYEGNCCPSDCPIYDHIEKLNEARKEIYGC